MKKPQDSDFEVVHGKTRGWFTRKLTEMKKVGWEPILDTFRIVPQSLLEQQSEKFNYFILVRRK